MERLTYVVAGSYEGKLFGFKFLQMEGKVLLQPIFEESVHTGSVRALGAENNTLVTGSDDETIRVYNVQTRKSIGIVDEHKAKITSLNLRASSDGSNMQLISTDASGDIKIWKAKGWELLSELKGHKDEVLDFAVHPTGRIGLSISKDKTMRMWNLIHGRSSHITKLSEDPVHVRWSPDGLYYSLLFDNKVRVFSVANGKVRQTFESKQKLLASIWVASTWIVVAGEARTIDVYDVESGKLVMSLAGHKNRIKDLAVIERLRPSEVNPDNVFLNYIVSISSDKFVKVWDLHTKKTVAREFTDARLICVTISTPYTALEFDPVVAKKIRRLSDPPSASKRLKKSEKKSSSADDVSSRDD